MSTVRLVIVILVLGTVLLLAVQNTSPALPLVFLGMTSLALPLAVWLMLALSLGSLTTLLFTALLGAGYGGNHRRQSAYKYRPQPFYEPSPAANAAAREQADSGSRSRPSTTADRVGIIVLRLPRPRGQPVVLTAILHLRMGGASGKPGPISPLLRHIATGKP
jgi:uncharacterized integral membrane protein